MYLLTCPSPPVSDQKGVATCAEGWSVSDDSIYQSSALPPLSVQDSLTLAGAIIGLLALAWVFRKLQVVA
jgi:hypothetical protein